jgi:hypothetical protein
MTTLVRNFFSVEFLSLIYTAQVIALHTFVAVWWDKGARALSTAKIIMIAVWLYNILFVTIGIAVNERNDYEVPVPVTTFLSLFSSILTSHLI